MGTPDETLVPPASGKDEANVARIARQAIVDEARNVYGYELFDRSTAVNAHTAATDAALLFNALSYAGTEALVGKKTVFINCTHESLTGGHLELIHPDKVVLEVPPLGESATALDIEASLATFNALRQRGFRLAFDQNLLRRAYASWLPMASFIKLDMRRLSPADAEVLVKFARSYTHAQIVAEKVETAEQFEHMRSLGIKLFQGFWFAQPQLVEARTTTEEAELQAAGIRADAERYAAETRAKIHAEIEDAKAEVALLRQLAERDELRVRSEIKVLQDEAVQERMSLHNEATKQVQRRQDEADRMLADVAARAHALNLEAEEHLAGAVITLPGEQARVLSEMEPDAFAREVARRFASGAPLPEIAAAAERFGVRLA